MRDNDEYEQALETLRKLRICGIDINAKQVKISLARQGHIYNWILPVAKTASLRVEAGFKNGELFN